VAHAKARALELIRSGIRSTTGAAPVYLGDYVTLEQGTGIVTVVAGLRLEDFHSCRRYGMKDDDILNPVRRDGRFAGSLPFFGGEKIWERIRRSSTKLRESGALCTPEKSRTATCTAGATSTPIIYRATTQWFAGMDDVPGWKAGSPSGRCARWRSRASTRRSSSRVGQGRLNG
jgi:isoleucyl-tRNA synthetase